VLKITTIVCEKASNFRHHVTRNVTRFTLFSQTPRLQGARTGVPRIAGEIGSARQYPVIARGISTIASREARVHRHWHTPCSP
jgi:hypothetical protein